MQIWQETFLFSSSASSRANLAQPAWSGLFHIEKRNAVLSEKFSDIFFLLENLTQVKEYFLPVARG